jgi:hypothetical protein
MSTWQPSLECPPGMCLHPERLQPIPAGAPARFTTSEAASSSNIGSTHVGVSELAHSSNTSGSGSGKHSASATQLSGAPKLMSPVSHSN